MQFVLDFRAVLYDLRFPPLKSLAYLVVCTVAALAVGYRFFVSHDGRLPEEV